MWVVGDEKQVGSTKFVRFELGLCESQTEEVLRDEDMRLISKKVSFLGIFEYPENLSLWILGEAGRKF